MVPQSDTKLDAERVNRLPEPVFDAKPEWVDFYWLAWEQAWEHVVACPGAPQSPYMAEGCNTTTIWIWDTCLMALFCKYAPDLFPGMESLQNFYGPMYDGQSTPQRIHHPDNPPLFAWVEYAHARFTGNLDRLRRVFGEKRYLQKHFDFFESAKPGDKWPWSNVPLSLKRLPEGFLWSGNPSGMDNTPRGRDDYDGILWVDALAQQALAALYMARIADLLGEAREAEHFRKQHRRLGLLIHALYWNETDGIYYDVRRDDTTRHVPVKTPAAYWPMMAELCDALQARRLRDHAMDPAVFGGPAPWPSVSFDDPDFVSQGMYWRGGIWLPTAYMAIKSLEKYNHFDAAEATSHALLDHMHRTYTEYEPHTIWECYSPTAPAPATAKDNMKPVRADFCGWSALGPISLFIENILGFHTVDGIEKRVEWRKTQPGRHGIRRLRFGGIETDILADGDVVEATSTAPYTLVVNERPFEIQAGRQRLAV